MKLTCSSLLYDKKRLYNLFLGSVHAGRLQIWAILAVTPLHRVFSTVEPTLGPKEKDTKDIQN
jgi:hypothetical protein